MGKEHITKYIHSTGMKKLIIYKIYMKETTDYAFWWLELISVSKMNLKIEIFLEWGIHVMEFYMNEFCVSTAWMTSRRLQRRTGSIAGMFVVVPPLPLMGVGHTDFYLCLHRNYHKQGYQSLCCLNRLLYYFFVMSHYHCIFPFV